MLSSGESISSDEIKAAAACHRMNSMSKQKKLRTMIDTLGQPTMFSTHYFDNTHCLINIASSSSGARTSREPFQEKEQSLPVQILKLYHLSRPPYFYWSGGAFFKKLPSHDQQSTEAMSMSVRMFWRSVRGTLSSMICAVFSNPNSGHVLTSMLW